MAMKKNQLTSGCRLVGAAFLGALLASGCATTYQKRSVKGSGFLSDYRQLKACGGDAALLRYIDPNADFKAYTKILLDPVLAYAASKDSGMAKLSKDKQRDLVNYFDAALREQLKKNFTLVDQPGPGVLRLRVAITEAKGSMILLDTASSVIPVGIALSAVKAIATGKHLAVGEIGAECEGLDAVTGKRVFAAVDARVGSKFTLRLDKFNRWHAAEDACDFWAARLHERLIEETGKKPAAR